MFKYFMIFFSLSLISIIAHSAPSHGDVKGELKDLVVWHQDLSKWIQPDDYFSIEIKRYNGKTFGTVTDYPPYETVNEFDTLIDKLPDGRICPMVFYHQRWRRLPDVLALDERLRNYGGCKDVFN